MFFFQDNNHLHLQDNVEPGPQEATPPLQDADSALPTPQGTTPTPSERQETESPIGTSLSGGQGQAVATPPAGSVASASDEGIPSQLHIQKHSTSTLIKDGGVVSTSPSPSETTVGDQESIQTATPPPPVEGMTRSDPVTPASGGLLSRLKKRVVETAWQGAESKVSPVNPHTKSHNSELRDVFFWCAVNTSW